MAIKVLLLGESPSEIASMERLIVDEEFFIEGSSMNLTNASDEVMEYRPDMVLMYCSDLSWVFRACQQIYLLHPNVVTVMVSDDPSYEMAKRSIECGATTYISPIPEAERFCEELKRVYNNEKSRFSMLVEKSGKKRNAEVITVFGTKGGVGKTTLAVNLAVELSRKKSKVIILDLDLLFGDSHMFLGLDVKDTIVDMLQEQKVPTIDSIRNYFVLHSSGIQVLCAPSSPEFAGNVTASQIEPIINILRLNYDYIIIDTTSEFSDLNLHVLEEANTILYVTGLDISVLNNSKKGLLLLDTLNLKSKVKVVVNRAFKGDISIYDVEKIMDKPVVGTISNDYIEAVRALNQGVPLVFGSNRSPIGKEISRIANIFSDDLENEEKKGKKSILSGLSLKLPKVGGRK